MPQRFSRTGITDFVRTHGDLSARHPEKEIRRLVRKADKQSVPSKSLYVTYYKLRREARVKMLLPFRKPLMHKTFTPTPKGLPFGVFPEPALVVRLGVVVRFDQLPQLAVVDLAA